MTGKVFRWVAVSLTGIAVSLICLISLINFHQYHIYHQPLLHQMVAIKPSADKFSKILTGKQVLDLAAVLPEALVIIKESIFSVIQHRAVPMPVFDEAIYSPLRAPPVA